MKMTWTRGLLASVTLMICASARPVTGQERNVYWGDTHLHTSYSFDAYRFGNVTVDPETAYRFAKGLPVVDPGLGHRVRLERPLDFLVVSDHTPMGREGEAVPFDGDKNTPEFQELVWSLSVDAAERHNDPGTFTTMMGWEWTSTPGGAMMHRVVFTPADGETAKRFIPLSAGDGPRPEDLWNWLEETSDRLGIDFVAIPHNSNLSMGLMFDMVEQRGPSHQRRVREDPHEVGASRRGAPGEGQLRDPSVSSRPRTSSRTTSSISSSSAEASPSPTPATTYVRLFSGDSGSKKGWA